jgi:hypothetical protein
LQEGFQEKIYHKKEIKSIKSREANLNKQVNNLKGEKSRVNSKDQTVRIRNQSNVKILSLNKKFPLDTEM